MWFCCKIISHNVNYVRYACCVKMWELQQIMLLNTELWFWAWSMLLSKDLRKFMSGVIRSSCACRFKFLNANNFLTSSYSTVLSRATYILHQSVLHCCVIFVSLGWHKQVEGLARVVNQDLAKLCREAKELKAKFPSFHISHVPRVRIF